MHQIRLGLGNVFWLGGSERTGEESQCRYAKEACPFTRQLFRALL